MQTKGRFHNFSPKFEQEIPGGWFFEVWTYATMAGRMCVLASRRRVLSAVATALPGVPAGPGRESSKRSPVDEVVLRVFPRNIHQFVLLLNRKICTVHGHAGSSGQQQHQGLIVLRLFLNCLLWHLEELFAGWIRPNTTCPYSARGLVSKTPGSS